MDGSTYIVESLPAVRTAEKAGTAAYTAGGGGAIGGNQEYPARCGDEYGSTFQESIRQENQDVNGQIIERY